MTNKCSIKQAEFLLSLEARGGSGWAARYIKDMQRKEILKLALAAPVLFSSSKPVLLFHRIKIQKQIKLGKLDTYSKVLNSLATFLLGGVLINTSSLIILFSDGGSWCFNMLFCCFYSVLCVYVCVCVCVCVCVSLLQKPTSQVHLCFEQV